jgi:hypothetical protein
MDELIEFAGHLPTPAAVAFAVVLAAVIGVSWRGILKGRELDPGKDVPAAAMVVDPNALNALAGAVTRQTDVMEEMLATGKDLARSFDHIAVELDRVREEMRIQREVRRG